MDCILKNNILGCDDPCVYYNWLDGSDRYYSINSTKRFLTDRYNFGWFRYKNGMGIKNGCVGPLKCNSLRPLSLNGILPTFEEGVKMVSVYSNYDTGCKAGTPIPVKACYRNSETYYVYKFSGLLTYDVYCTDYVIPPTTTTTEPTTTTTTEPTTISPTTTAKPNTTIPEPTTTAAADPQPLPLLTHNHCR
ncbi:G8 domain-containing protein DDB_G0286311-like [Pelobates fuscus]|uniref:G8 domain-containing protein DDB_G0286311-like n=1 Tax=Pelobates fuscus TaxID=191477 RepID=UPI002FE46771